MILAMETYNVVPTGIKEGLIEIVPDALTLA